MPAQRVRCVILVIRIAPGVILIAVWIIPCPCLKIGRGFKLLQ
jgi:hypothetical protein